MKLTNATFLIGALTSLVAFDRPLRKIGAFALGSAAGGLAMGGTWAWMLWQQFGSPVFPFYNTIFRSPEAPLMPFADGRFMPRGLLDAMAYPFYWLVGIHPSSEEPFRDPRFAVVIVLLMITIVVGLVRNVQILRQRDKQFMLFLVVSYGAWLEMFSIHRYAIGLELMAAPMIVLLLTRLCETLDGPDGSRGLRVRNAVVIAAALAIALWSRPADWSRRPWSDPYRPQLAGDLLTPATYMLLEKPVGYVVPLLPTASQAYQLADILLPIAPGGILDQRIRQGLAHPLEGGVRALFLAGSQPRNDLLAPYDLAIDEARTCERIPGADGRDVAACPLIRKLQASRGQHS